MERKKLRITLISFFTLLAFGELQAQFGNGFGNRMGGMGRQRNTIPQVQEPEREPEKLTAAQMVDQQMPKIIETLSLDPFEEAVVRTALTNSVQKKMELQILQLEPEKMKEAYQKIRETQNAEIKAALPEEKYMAYLEMMENPEKMNRQAKKKKKKKKKKDASN